MNVQIDTLVSVRRTHLDLFSGIGGFALAARWAGFETVAFCEIEEFPRKVLAKNFPGVTIHRDIRELDGGEYAGIELITGGYPCQPFSVVGKREGAADDRHLWPEMRRIIAQAKPRWVVAENVTGHVTLGLDSVLTDLEGLDYSAGALVIPAAAVGALHKRERVWVVANSNHWNGKPSEVSRPKVHDEATKQRANGDACSASCGIERWKAIEPGVPVVADRIPGRVDKFRAAGNAIVPQVAYEILRAISAH